MKLTPSMIPPRASPNTIAIDMVQSIKDKNNIICIVDIFGKYSSIIRAFDMVLDTSFKWKKVYHYFAGGLDGVDQLLRSRRWFFRSSNTFWYCYEYAHVIWCRRSYCNSALFMCFTLQESKQAILPVPWGVFYFAYPIIEFIVCFFSVAPWEITSLFWLWNSGTHSGSALSFFSSNRTTCL